MVAKVAICSNFMIRAAGIAVMLTVSVLLCLFSDSEQLRHEIIQTGWNDHTSDCSQAPEFCNSMPQQLQSGNFRRIRCNSGFRSFPAGSGTLLHEELIFVPDTLYQTTVSEDIRFTYHSYSRCAIPVRAGPDAC